MDKPNCYQCVHRREIPGNAHTRCAHPAFDKIEANPVLGLLATLTVARGYTINAKAAECKVVGHSRGIAGGWFNHPFNFDPTWLQSCTGFEPKQAPA